MSNGRRRELVAAIEASPDLADTYLVLADVLQGLGDPRGEAIVRWHGGTTGVRIEIEKQLGPPPPRHGDVEWFCGFIRRARTILDEDEPEAFRAYLDHPSLQFVQHLDLDVPGSPYPEERQWVIEHVASRLRPTLRTLAINSYVRGGSEPPIGDLDLAPLWARLPGLTSLRIHARFVTPGSLLSNRLSSLMIDGEVDGDAMIPLLNGTMPALRELSLHDVGEPFAERFKDSALAAQLTKVELTRNDPADDRYAHTGE